MTWGRTTPAGERAQLARWGKAHLVASGSVEGPGQARCGATWAAGGAQEPAEDLRTCVPCRRDAMGQAPRTHRRRGRRGRRRFRIGSRPTEDVKRRELERQDHRERMEERPGFGRYLASRLPRFLRRGDR